MSEKESDTICWRELKLDDRLWKNKGVFLGKCVWIGVEGSLRDPDPVFQFENGIVLSGLLLKFTEIIEI
jgi:hypothetical protein